MLHSRDQENTVHRALTNTAWGLASYVWPICFAIFITPLVLRAMGAQEFGFYVFVNTVVSFLGLLDFGLASAVSKYLAEYYGQRDSVKIRSLIGTSFTLFFLIGILGSLVFIGGSFLPYTRHLFVAYSQYQPGIIAAGLMFFFSSLNSLNSIAFTALQRFDLSGKIGIISLTIQQLAILSLILSGRSINSIFIALAIITAASTALSAYCAGRILPELRTGPSWNVAELIKCYRFGLVTFVNNLATVSISYLDRMIIPFVLGPSSLTFYSLPGNITTRIPGIANSMSSVLFPMTASLSGINEGEKIKRLYIRSFRLITVIAAAIAITVAAFARDILTYWISPSFAAESTHVLIVLAATNLILALGGPLSGFLLGLGKTKFLTASSIVMAIINLVLLLILLPVWGIDGAAWAYLLSVLPIAYMFFYTERHFLGLTERRQYWREIILGNALVGAITLLIAHYALKPFVHSLASLLAISAAAGAIYLALYWAFGFFESEDVASIRSFAARAFRRSK